jgi:hypothetical protein
MMGRERYAKLERREDRKIREKLEELGVTERARQAYLGLRRRDVQEIIQNAFREDVPFAQQRDINLVAREALESFGYDLSGIDISIGFRPGKVVYDGVESKQLPPTAVFKADASAEAVAEAAKAAGVRHYTLGSVALSLN